MMVLGAVMMMLSLLREVNYISFNGCILMTRNDVITISLVLL